MVVLVVTIAVILIPAHMTATSINLNDAILLKAIAQQIIEDAVSSQASLAANKSTPMIASTESSAIDSTPTPLPASTDVIDDPLLKLIHQLEEVKKHVKPVVSVQLNDDKENGNLLMGNNDLLESNEDFNMLSGRRRYKHYKKEDYPDKKKKHHSRREKEGLSLEVNPVASTTAGQMLTKLRLHASEDMTVHKQVTRTTPKVVLTLTGRTTTALASSEELQSREWRPNHKKPRKYTGSIIRRQNDYRPPDNDDKIAGYMKLLQKDRVQLNRLEKHHHKTHAHAHGGREGQAEGQGIPTRKTLLRNIDGKLSGAQLDMSGGLGSKILAMQFKGRVCQRHVMMPEGPKYDREGQPYVAAWSKKPGYPDYPSTSDRSFLIPACCNCCVKSVLGCE